MSKLRVVVLGEGLLFHFASKRIADLGHTIVARLGTSGTGDTSHGTITIRNAAEIDDQLTSLSCDILLSISNPFILSKNIIAHPYVAAVNFHNSLLPAYAGLRATAWAIANGEPEHGITWHLIEPGIDTGAMLVQRRFALNAAETTASLNARCTAEALDAVDELFELLATGQTAGLRQDLALRTYFGREDTAPQAGILAFCQSTRQIVQLVRACHWGVGANDFGFAKIMLDHQSTALVLHAEPAAAGGPIGTVLDVDEATLTVACGDGAVRLTLDRVSGAVPGTILPIPSLEHIPEMLEYKNAILRERDNIALYQAAAPTASPPSPNGDCGTLQTTGSVDRFLIAVSRVLGRGTVCAFETGGGSLDLLHSWTMGYAAGGKNAALPLTRDIHRRRPDLDELKRWPEPASIHVLIGNRPADLPSGAIAFGADGSLHYRGVEATANALAKAMTQIEPETNQTDYETTVPWQVLATARTHPCASAIEENGRTTTYAELVAQARTIASVLIAAGTKAEDGVGILLPAGGAFAATALGAMLAGAAYVPLDPTSPPQRLLVEIEEAGVTQVVTTREFGTVLAATPIAVLFIEHARAPEPAFELPRASPNACAYRIFTSGSSGRPKAVEITHGALANLVQHCRDALPLAADDRMTMLARPTFDAAVADTWPILVAGGVLLVPPPGLLLDQPRLLEWFAASRATCAFVPTAIVERLLHLPHPPGLALRTLLTGGAALRRRPPPGLPYRLINSYGPTENTVASLWSIVTPGDGTPSIGFPIAGVTLNIVDDRGSPVRPGQAGELMLGGVQLARGYFGKPELTAQRFTTNTDGERVYHTGDLVRLNPEGDLEFCGRIDDQVQIRGIRVEPGEIEAQLLTDDRVAEAACLPWSSGGEVAGLIAFVVLERPPIDDDQVGASLLLMLKARLPTAMVPREIQIEAELPYKSSGKLDRDALAARIVESATGADTLDQAWQRALPNAGDSEGSFWELGGDSLAAITLLTELEALTGVRISTGLFLAQPTLRGLRRLIEDTPVSSAMELRSGRSPVVVCWYGLTGDLEAYQHLLAHLPGRRIVGIASPSLDDASHLPGTVEQAATRGLSDLEQIVGDAPLILLGYSFGGLLAFEAGRQLAERDRPPLFVGLLGTSPPQIAMNTLTRLTYLSRNAPRFAWRIVCGRQRLRLAWRAIPGEIMRMIGLSRAEPALPDWAQDTGMKQHLRMGQRYQPSVADMPVHLFRELGEKDDVSLRHAIRQDLDDLGWSRWLVAPAVVHWIDTRHLNMMSDAVGEVAALLNRLIGELADDARPRLASDSRRPAKSTAGTADPLPDDGGSGRQVDAYPPRFPQDTAT